MLKERITIDYMVYILDDLNKRGSATAKDICLSLRTTNCNSITNLRKMLSRMVHMRLLTSHGVDGYRLVKPYSDYILSDILNVEPSLNQSPVNKAEACLKIASANIKVKDLL